MMAILAQNVDDLSCTPFMCIVTHSKDVELSQLHVLSVLYLQTKCCVMANNSTWNVTTAYLIIHPINCHHQTYWLSKGPP